MVALRGAGWCPVLGFRRVGFVGAQILLVYRIEKREWVEEFGMTEGEDREIFMLR